MVDKSAQFTNLVRLGYAARGLSYLLLGYLALSTSGKAKEGATSVYDYLQEVPLGTPLLWLVALGLLGYAAFKALSAVADIRHYGREPKGIVRRIGDGASCLAYAFLAFAAFQFAYGARHTANDSTRKMAGTVLGWHIGPVVIGIIGLGFVAAAFVQAKDAWTAGFMHSVGGRAPRGIEAAGRAGYAARGIVFALVGWSLVKSAWFDSSSQVRGLGEAIVSLRDMGVIYILVAIGLALFGLFSLVTARYRIIPDLGKDDLKPRL